MPGWVYDGLGEARIIETLKVYDGAGNAKSAIGGWVYDGSGNAKRFLDSMRWTMDFSGPNHSCGPRDGPCASTITAACFVPMGSATYVDGVLPAGAFRVGHVKYVSPAAAGEFILWVAQAVVDPYIQTARITSIGGVAENATVTVHAYDATMGAYGYVFGPIARAMAPATSYRMVFSA